MDYKHIVKEIKTGPWKDTQQKALGLAVNTAVLAHSTAEGKAGQPRLAQSFSSGDLKFLGDPQVPFPT